MKRLYVILLIVISLSAVTYAANYILEKIKKGATLVHTENYEGVILSDPYFSDWTPSVELIHEFESGFIEYLTNYDNTEMNYEEGKLQFVIDNFKDYKRQYYGIKTKGRKVIYCNLLLINDDDSRMNWKEDLIAVLDGGPSFFSIEYEVRKKKYKDMMINGSA